MDTAEDLRDSLDTFAASCNENERLMAMIKDWNRVIHIQATDTGQNDTLITQNGVVEHRAEAPDSADLTIRSTADILTQVFYGELSPNEPYNEGTLRIQGPEDDIVRLDFIIAMLWE